MAAFTDFLQGLSGAERIAAYVAVVALAVLVALVLRRFTLAGRITESHGATPGPYAVAYTTGGAPRAILAALATLRAKEVIAVTEARMLTAVAAPPAGSASLERAVYDAIHSRRAQFTRDLGRDHAVREAIAATHAELLAAGVLVRPGARLLARVWALLPLVAVFALYRADDPFDLELSQVESVAADRAVLGFDGLTALAFLVTALLAVLATMLLLVVPRVTRGARKGLGELRQRHQHLTPGYSPSFTTYGANDAALAVALFGPAVLWSAYPDFALMTSHHQARNATSSCGSSFSSCGSGSSCGSSGGSSCGSSSGGSSCGGGGGCGGGS